VAFNIRKFAAALFLLGFVGTSALAVPITYTFSSASVSGSLNGTPFTNAAVTITAVGDTVNIPTVPIGVCLQTPPSFVCNFPLNVTFSVSGVGAGTVTEALYIFNLQSGPVLGLGRPGTADFMDVGNAAFATYGLGTPIAPITVTQSFLSGGGVTTNLGTLILANALDTFQAALGGAVSPPTIAKSFGAGTIPLNGSTSLSFQIANPNVASSLTGVGFTDTLPAGLVVSTPNGLTGSCGGGTITATAGSATISLSGASLAASSSCTFSVNTTATSVGVQTNTTGTVTSNEGGTGGTATASVTVTSGPPPPPPTAEPIPTLREWVLSLLALMLFVAGGFALHRRRSN
jgi:hypothetical protein